MLKQIVAEHKFKARRSNRPNNGNPCTAPRWLANSPNVSDEALIKSVAGGDRQAIRTLFARHNVRVFRFVLRFVRDKSMAEDVVSEVFFEAWRQAGQFEGRCEVSTWLLAMARNKAIAVYRRSSHVQLDEETATTLEDPSDDPAITLEKKDRSAILRKCLTQLSPLHREVVDLVYYHQKSVEEVAQITGAAKGTVKTRMFYARTQMKTLLGKEGINSVSM